MKETEIREKLQVVGHEKKLYEYSPLDKNQLMRNNNTGISTAEFPYRTKKTKNGVQPLQKAKAETRAVSQLEFHLSTQIIK